MTTVSGRVPDLSQETHTDKHLQQAHEHSTPNTTKPTLPYYANTVNIMDQSHNMSFHPSSPPSEGGADSYKYEDTPDTRLTVFSPQEDSVKSSRLLNALTLSTGKNDRSGKYGVGDSPIHRTASMDSIASVIHDKDPFISTTPEKTQTATKLSATASAFEPATCRPASVKPAAVNGTANNNSSLANTPKPMGRVLDTVPRSPTTGYQVWNALPLSAVFSFELDLSRSIHITCASGLLDDVAINQYFVVSRHRSVIHNIPTNSARRTCSRWLAHSSLLHTSFPLPMVPTSAPATFEMRPRS